MNGWDELQSTESTLQDLIYTIVCSKLAIKRKNRFGPTLQNSLTLSIASTKSTNYTTKASHSLHFKQQRKTTLLFLKKRKTTLLFFFSLSLSLSLSLSSLGNPSQFSRPDLTRPGPCKWPELTLTKTLRISPLRRPPPPPPLLLPPYPPLPLTANPAGKTTPPPPPPPLHPQNQTLHQNSETQNLTRLPNPPRLQARRISATTNTTTKFTLLLPTPAQAQSNSRTSPP